MKFKLNPLLGNMPHQRIGNIVAYCLKGSFVMRSVPGHIKDPKTPKQLMNRARMKKIFLMSQYFADVLKCSFPERPPLHTVYNSFVQANRSHVTVNEQMETTVDWSKLVCSAGSLAIPEVQARLNPDEHSIIFTVRGEWSAAPSYYTDVIYAAVCEKKIEDTLLFILKQRHESGEVSCPLPQQWRKENIEAYTFAVSATGKLASGTRYLPLRDDSGKK